MSDLQREALVKRRGQVEQLMAATGQTDEIMARSLLEAVGWDLSAAKAMMAESLSAAQQLQPAPVTVVFEEQTYKLDLPPSATVRDIKVAVEAETGVAPREQMLLEQTTQQELTDTSVLGDISAGVGGDVTIHLLTPNSAV
eukprot:m.486403 g.486403  ORF g.486403 m.486403 type:complete len:141 (+) comp24395_c0_seq1:140-562(+)